MIWILRWSKPISLNTFARLKKLPPSLCSASAPYPRDVSAVAALSSTWVFKRFSYGYSPGEESHTHSCQDFKFCICHKPDLISTVLQNIHWNTLYTAFLNWGSGLPKSEAILLLSDQNKILTGQK